MADSWTPNEIDLLIDVIRNQPDRAILIVPQLTKFGDPEPVILKIRTVRIVLNK
jgi:hypothetical protein